MNVKDTRTNPLALDKTWEVAAREARRLMCSLGVEEHGCHAIMTYVNGHTIRGWRVTVTRLEDGSSTTAFVNALKAEEV